MCIILIIDHSWVFFVFFLLLLLLLLMILEFYLFFNTIEPTYRHTHNCTFVYLAFQ